MAQFFKKKTVSIFLILLINPWNWMSITNLKHEVSIYDLSMKGKEEEDFFHLTSCNHWASCCVAWRRIFNVKNNIALVIRCCCCSRHFEKSFIVFFSEARIIMSSIACETTAIRSQCKRYCCFYSSPRSWCFVVTK